MSSDTSGGLKAPEQFQGFPYGLKPVPFKADLKLTHSFKNNE
jgi:hypothetical protein